MVEAEKDLEFANSADAAIFDSGIKTREIAKGASLLNRPKLDTQLQLVAAQCSGTLMLAKLGYCGSASVRRSDDHIWVIRLRWSIEGCQQYGWPQHVNHLFWRNALCSAMGCWP